MSTDLEFSPYEIDSLKELTNIGMGRAGAQLSEIFEHRVTFNVPNVVIVDPEQLSAIYGNVDTHGHEVNIIQQYFMGDIEGRSTIIIGDNNFSNMVNILGYEEQDAIDEKRQNEMLLDLANAVNSACMSGLAEELELKINFAHPTIIAVKQPATKLEEKITKPKDLYKHKTLLFEIKLYIKDIDFFCENVISLKVASISHLRSALERLL